MPAFPREELEEMVRRWATGRTVDLFSKLVLTVVLIASVSCAVAVYLPTRHAPLFYQDRPLALAATVFGGLLGLALATTAPAWWWLKRRRRVLSQQQPLLESLDT